MKRLACSRPMIAILAVACVLAWTAAFTAPDSDLHVSFIDVGEGDAILIRSASYKVLVDGGPSPQGVTGFLGQDLPFWDRRIDLVISTHPHADHLAGLLDVARRYEVGAVLASPYEIESGVYRQWRALIQSQGISYVTARAGQEVRLGSRATMEVLYPGDRSLTGTVSDPNNNSVVFRLVSGSFTALFAGDIEMAAENDLLSRKLNMSSVVLKVPHQGAATSLAQGFLDSVQPRIAVISTGKDNPYGHPAPETLAKLAGIQVYRTDLDGTVEIQTDGRTYSVKTNPGKASGRLD
ncbi:MAG: MBL fold metallo-hydrolase [Dehalococcoidia bacterium]|nr:MBL fold metallo-hydrolase [Dehalococcoidia bacterium]